MPTPSFRRIKLTTISIFVRASGWPLCARTKRVFSIDSVRPELLAIKDPLSNCVLNTAPDTLFKGTADRVVVDQFRGMVSWAQGEMQFTAEAKAEFSSVA